MQQNNKSILSISLDTSIVLGDLSASGLRQLRYAKNFDNYVVILISTKKDHLKSEYHFGNLHIYPTNVLFKPYAILRGLKLVQQLHNQYHFDVMTAQDPLATGMIAAMAKRLLQIPLNIQLHSTYHFARGWEDEAWSHMFWKQVITPVLKRADSIRTVNHTIIPILKNQFPHIATTVKHIPVIVDLQIFKNKIKKKNELDKFITVGRLAPEKNHELLLEAFARVKKLKPDVRLTIVGEGSEKNALKFAVKALGLTSSVTFAGKQNPEQVRELLVDHDIYVSSSNYEGWGNAIIEAMAVGLPVVATKVGCLADEWLGKDIAKTAPVRNKQMLADAMLWYMLNPDEAYETAQKAQAAVLDKLDTKKLEQQWIDLLQRT